MTGIQKHIINNDLRLLHVSESKCHICHQANRFINLELFDERFMEHFLRELKPKREATGYSGPALLILDGCAAHDGDYFWTIYLGKNVVAIPIPAHASNQSQPCDHCVFGLTKRLVRPLKKTGDAHAQF
jgi:hypothetical protein